MAESVKNTESKTTGQVGIRINMSPEDDPVNDTARMVKQQIERALQLSKKEGPLPETTGLMALSASFKAIHEKLQQERKKREAQIRFTLKQVMQMIEARIAEIEQQIDRNNAQIDQNNERIAELKCEIEVIVDLEGKIRKEGYDPDDPEQVQMLKQLGVDPDKLEGKSPDEIYQYLETLRLARLHELGALGDANDRLNKENDQLYRERDRLKKVLRQTREQEQGIESRASELAAKSETLEERSAKCQTTEEFESLKQERLQVLDEIKTLESNANELREERKRIIAYKNKDIRNEQIALQESHAGIEDRGELQDHMVKDSENIASPENEIERFMKELAKSQTIENKMDRLQREQELVSALSPEAADQLSMDEHTEEMFKPDYFKPLENASASLAKSSPALTTNLSLG